MGTKTSSNDHIDAEAIHVRLQAVRQQAHENHHRALVVIAGERSWCDGVAQLVLCEGDLEEYRWLSQSKDAPHPYAIKAKDVARLLGSESPGIVVDAFAGFDPDAFGGICGTVRAGGLVILLCPALSDWPRFEDPEYHRMLVYPYEPRQMAGHFLRHLVNTILGDPSRLLIEQGRPLPHPCKRVDGDSSSSYQDRFREQRQGIEAVIKVATGHRRRPLVLIADRGRGKSSALGLASAELLNSGRLQHIVVTGPNRDSVQAIFQHAQGNLKVESAGENHIRTATGSLEFIAPDQLVSAQKCGQFLLVDEAAAIPSPILEILLQKYSRIVFASTVHGYEGTGRGFEVRFFKVLDRFTPQWRQIRFQAPIRWASGDPLERFLGEALLFNAAPAQDQQVIDARAGDCVIERIDVDELLEDRRRLQQLFGLLVTAHYRTRPYDLRHLLDGPNLEVFLGTYNGQVVATALVAKEGGLTSEIAHRVWQGNARPRGHLLAESVAVHLGQPPGAQRLCARMMRIAVHPILQHRGIGSELVRQVETWGRQQGLDYLGTSFGATPSLLRFWHRAGFAVTRVSQRKGASSGSRSALLLKPISEQGDELAHTTVERFWYQFPHQLMDSLTDLSTPMVLEILAQIECTPVQTDRQDYMDATSYAQGGRQLEDCIASIWKLVLGYLSAGHKSWRLNESELGLLVKRILQRHHWSTVVNDCGFDGRRQADQHLRRLVQRMLGQWDSGSH